MKKSLILLFLLLIPLATAQQENYNDRTGLTIDYDSNGEILLIGSSGFDSLTTTLYLNPIESSRQTVQSLTTTPNSNDNGEDLIFKWTSFQDPFTYQISSKITTQNNLYPVK